MGGGHRSSEGSKKNLEKRKNEEQQYVVNKTNECLDCGMEHGWVGIEEINGKTRQETTLRGQDDEMVSS